VLNDIKEGPGAISTLMYDSVMAINLKESMHNMNTTTVLLNENLEALKHSFPVKGYFKKEAKRQAKEEKKVEN
jgi:phospholipid/cholesterol/gamma-HCH transport system substrate-binding protein